MSNNEGSKLSFSFNKVIRKGSFQKKPVQNVELIESFENNEVQVINKQEINSEPLTIKLPENSHNISDRIIAFREKRKLESQKTFNKSDLNESELTLEEQAVKELLAESNDDVKSKKPMLVLPSTDKLIIEGKEESTLDDYESVPIEDFGFAMLRGMGWKEDMPIGKRQKKITPRKDPQLRPKGMGLGVQMEKKVEVDDSEIIKKGSFVKIKAGRHKGCICQVKSFDDEAGLIILTTDDGIILSLHEFLVELVSKKDYKKINSSGNKKQ